VGWQALVTDTAFALFHDTCCLLKHRADARPLGYGQHSRQELHPHQVRLPATLRELPPEYALPSNLTGMDHPPPQHLIF
jgi:hypothetical protein